MFPLSCVDPTDIFFPCLFRKTMRKDKKQRFQGIIACFGYGGNLMEQRFGVCFVMEGLKINR